MTTKMAAELDMKATQVDGELGMTYILALSKNKNQADNIITWNISQK